MDKSKRSYWVASIDDPWFGIGVGVIIGALGSRLSVKWLVILGWAIASISVYRHDPFNKGRLVRLLGNTVLALILGGGLIVIWRFLPPPPPDPLTKDEAQAMFAAHSVSVQPLQPVPKGGEPITRDEFARQLQQYKTSVAQGYLANLTNERVNEILKSDLLELRNNISQWGVGERSILVSYGERYSRMPLNNGTPGFRDMTPAERVPLEKQEKEERARLRTDMIGKTKDSLIHLCDLSAEILSNRRLHSWEVPKLLSQFKPEELCPKFKNGDYRNTDASNFYSYMESMQNALEASINAK